MICVREVLNDLAGDTVSSHRKKEVHFWVEWLFFSSLSFNNNEHVWKIFLYILFIKDKKY